MLSEYIPHPEDWPHQSYAVTESVKKINGGWVRFCVTSPTGGGKSRIVQRLCEHYIENGLRVVVMSNRRLLTDQLLKGLHKNGIEVGCRAADFEEWSNPSAMVQVISAQTEASRVLGAREKYFRDVELHRADLLINDEAHMNRGTQACQIINEYRDKFHAVIIGISATPLGIGHIYSDGLIVAGNNSELRDCGALVWANRFEPEVMDLSKVRFVSQAEAERTASDRWGQHVVASLLRSWKATNPDARPSIGMAPGVPESLGIAQDYWRHGINAAHIDAEGIFVNGEYKRTNEQRDRDELFAMLQDGTVPQIWNRYILREGVDFPWLYMLQLATPIVDLKGYVQVCGRVLRSHPTTPIVRIVDHAGCIRMHGSPNDDRDRDWKQYFYNANESQVTEDRHERMTSPTDKPKEPITCPKCGAMRDSGPKCMNKECGHEHAKSVRQVIQEDGTLKPATGDVYKKRRVSTAPDVEKKWAGCLFSALNSGRNFNQAIGDFKRKYYETPPSGLQGMPIKQSDLSRRVDSVPKNQLHGMGESDQPMVPTRKKKAAKPESKLQFE